MWEAFWTGCNLELDGYAAEQGETTAGGSVLTFAYDSSTLAASGGRLVS